jgi:hypothetical protein
MCFALLAVSCASEGCGNSKPAAPPPVILNPTTQVTIGGGSVDTKLPPLPTLTNVTASVNGDAANFSFDPVDGAKDYRIYVLPADSDITANSDGTLTVKNALYRCSGQRPALFMLQDQKSTDTNNSNAGGTTIVNGNVAGFNRTEADEQLGYVYTGPGAGRSPVYVLATYTGSGEEGCGRALFNSTRIKTYTTDPMKRTTMLAAGARDDGIAFYVPAAGAGTRPVYTTVVDNGGHNAVCFTDGPEASARGGGSTIFNILTASQPETAPLMRVNVQPYCGDNHDELVAGKARAEQVRYQGDQPIAALRWAGLTAKTTLVIEALDQGCPDVGFFSPQHADAVTKNLSYPAMQTLDDLKSASPSGEVVVNGQFDAANRPKAIARSFAEVSPAAPPQLDFYAGFEKGSTPEKFTEVANEWASKRYQSDTWSLAFYQNDNWYFGQEMGELWLVYYDVGGDTGGRFRLTPKKTGTISDTGFLYVTGEFDLVSSDRRYPQIIISNQSIPVGDPNTEPGSDKSLDNLSFPGAKTLILQLRNYTPSFLELEACDARGWNVSDQCPRLPMPSITNHSASPLPSELFGVDRTVKVDVYVSTARVYVFLNEMPYSCTRLPAKGEDGKPYSAPSGDVTITFGDVLYHSQADLAGPAGSGLDGTTAFQYHRSRMHFITRRHLDNLGFSSGVAAPTWDETRFPCRDGM